MRKQLKILLPVLAALLLLAGAAAADGPVNPHQSEVWRIERLASEGLSPADVQGVAPNASGAPVTVKCTKTPVLDGTGSWKISTNSSYGTVTRVLFYIMMKDFSSDYTTVYMKEYSGLRTSFTSCKLVTGGKYRFLAFVEYNNQGVGYIETDDFTLEDDSAHTSLTEKIAEVVRRCKSGTQWQTAVKMHDWLVNNVYYDRSLEYYGADLILRGYGVCDGYSKAFVLMCKAAGIPVYRIANDNHAWNAVKLDGKWYFIDCTWDDPINESNDHAAVSGFERRTYFCLNEELLALDHPKPWEWTNTSPKSCTALDDNYTVRSKEWKNWGDYYYDYDQSKWAVDTLPQQIGNTFALGEPFFTMNWGNKEWLWIIKNGEPSGVHIEERERRILVYAISKELFTFDGESVRVKAETKNSQLQVRLAGWNIQETGTLTIPKQVKNIPAYAFQGSRATTLVIQKGCKTIGEGAFRNSGVRTVTIPSSVTYIDPGAFEGCGRIIFVTANPGVIQLDGERNDMVVAP